MCVSRHWNKAMGSKKGALTFFGFSSAPITVTQKCGWPNRSTTISLRISMPMSKLSSGSVGVCDMIKQPKGRAIFTPQRYASGRTIAMLATSLYNASVPLTSAQAYQLDLRRPGLICTVKWFSDNTGIQFGLDKWAKVAFKKGSLVKFENIILDINTEQH